MQKIKLVDNTEILNISTIINQTTKIGNDEREVIDIYINKNEINSFDYINSKFPTGKTVNLSSITIYNMKVDEGTHKEHYIVAGIHDRFDTRDSIKIDDSKNQIIVRLVRTSQIEQQLLDLQLAIAELGVISQGGNE